MAILEPQPLATGVACKQPCTAVTAKEIIHFFIGTNPVRTKRPKLIQIKSKLRKLWELEV